MQNFVATCYHRGRDHCQAVSLSYFMQYPDEDMEGWLFAVFDNRTAEEIEFFVPHDHMEYMQEMENMSRGSGWREFLCCYLDEAIEDLDAALDDEWNEEG